MCSPVTDTRLLSSVCTIEGSADGQDHLILIFEDTVSLRGWYILDEVQWLPNMSYLRGRNSIAVLDNCSTHENVALREVLEPKEQSGICLSILR
jgi:hypothetical protein